MMCRTGNNNRKWAFVGTVAVLLFAAAMESSAEIYKYRDASGQIIFTDNPPENARDVEEVRPVVNTGIQMQPKQGANGTAPPAKDDAKAKLEQKKRKAKRRLEDRERLRAELKAELEAAQARLKQLEENRESEKVPRPEELGHSAIRNNTWLKESYYKRMAEVDEEIEAARKDVAQAERNLRLMKRSPRNKKK